MTRVAPSAPRQVVFDGSPDRRLYGVARGPGGRRCSLPPQRSARMRRCELTDGAWLRLESLLPSQGAGGRWNDRRTTLNGIFWVLNSDAPGRDLPPRYGKWPSVCQRIRRYARDGTRQRMLHTLRLHGRRREDRWGRSSTSAVRVSTLTDPPRTLAKTRRPHESDDHGLGRSPGVSSSLFQRVADGNGVPRPALITPGQRHESAGAEASTGRVRVGDTRRPNAVAGGHAYGIARIREWCTRRGIRAVIPEHRKLKRKRGRPRWFDRGVYGRRNVVG